MSDLVDRLRWNASGWDFPGETVHDQIGEARKLFREAADRIEELERPQNRTSAEPEVDGCYAGHCVNADHRTSAGVVSEENPLLNICECPCHMKAATMFHGPLQNVCCDKAVSWPTEAYSAQPVEDDGPDYTAPLYEREAKRIEGELP